MGRNGNAWEKQMSCSGMLQADDNNEESIGTCVWPVCPPVVWKEDETMGTVASIGVLAGETQVGAVAIHQAAAMPLRLQQAGLTSRVQAGGAVCAGQG